jgi:hypothetical protein
VAPKVGCTAVGGGGAVSGELRGKEAVREASGRVVALFTVEVALDQTLGSWYRFIKPTYRIKNVLTVK